MPLLADMPIWLGVAAAVAAAAVLVLGWVIIFRNAMRRPNNGNEFSEDTIPGG